MIVEPAPAGPTGRGRRALRVAALVVPVVLLAGTVTAGALGPKEDLARATPPPVAHEPAPAASSSPAPANQPAVAVTFPTVAADLAVLAIPEAAARIDRAEPGPFAVAGFLAEVGPYPPCAAATGDTRGDLGPLCLRHARLESLADDQELGPHLDLTIAPGARLPAMFERFGGAGRPVPIVLVGHRGPRPEPCHPTIWECYGSLVVERVTWVDGEAFDPGPIYDAGLEVAPVAMMYRNLDAATTLAIGWSGTILMEALIRPSTVSALDSAAAGQLADAPKPETLVWYVRGLETGYDPALFAHGSAPPRYSWVVLDYETGATLARGPKRDVSP